MAARAADGRLTGAAVVLVLATLGAFAPLWNAQFIRFDDPGFVVENPMVARGLTAESVRWAFTSGENANWYPVTRLSHLLDAQLFGIAPRGHHLGNLALHAAAALVLFLALRAATGGLWPSLVVAALFALHPLHVESVAWVSERSDVLAGFFVAVTLGAYVRFARRPSPQRYALVMLALSLGLMAKPTVVSLPVVLLLLDFWPLGRLGHGAGGQAGRGHLLSPWRAVAEKVPLVLLAAGAAAIALRSQAHAGAISMAFEMEDRLAVTLPQVPLSYVGYLKKALWPAGLAIFYPHPGHAMPLGRSLAAAAALAVLTGAALWQWRRRPWVPLGWLWYLVVLVPMVGLVQVGSQAMADRYSYLPLIGVFILATGGASEGLARARHPRWAGPLAAVLVLSIHAGLTFRQAGFWRDDRALFTHALAVTGDGNPVAHNILGKVALDAGDMAGAAAHYQAALAVQPLSPSSLFNGGIALSAIGRRKEAIGLFVQYAQLRPRNVEVRYNLGVLYADAGRLAEAEKMLREVLALAPGHPQALAQLKRLQR